MVTFQLKVGLIVVLTQFCIVKVQTTCAVGWNEYDSYCYKYVSLSPFQSTWENAVDKCAQQGIQQAYPLIENRSIALTEIITHAPKHQMSSLYKIGLRKVKTGDKPVWFDGDTTMPVRECNNKDFKPWDLHRAGLCGHVVLPDGSEPSDVCIAWLQCKTVQFSFNYQYAICQYQKSAYLKKCPKDFIPSPDGKKCIQFLPKSYRSWCDAFCSSYRQEMQLIDIRSLLDYWWLRHFIASQTSAGEGAFVGLSKLGSKSNRFFWLNGNPTQTFIRFLQNSGSCASVSYDRVLYDYTFNMALNANRCGDPGTMPAIIQYIPGSKPDIKHSVYCSVAQYCYKYADSCTYLTISTRMMCPSQK